MFDWIDVLFYYSYAERIDRKKRNDFGKVACKFY